MVDTLDFSEVGVLGGTSLIDSLIDSVIDSFQDDERIGNRMLGVAALGLEDSNVRMAATLDAIWLN